MGSILGLKRKEVFVKRINLTTSTASESVPIHELLKRRGLVTGIQLRPAGQVTAAGGGGVSGETRLIPLQFALNEIDCALSYQEAKPKTFYKGGPDEPYFLNSLRRRKLLHLAAASPNAGASGNFAAVLDWEFGDLRKKIYIDLRSVTSWTLKINAGAVTAYASTNVSTAQLITLDIIAIVWDGPGMPKQGSPHFVPGYDAVELDASGSNRKQDSKEVTGDGLVRSLTMRQHDDSAIGNAELVDGLVRRVTIDAPEGPIVDDVPWQVLKERTRAKAPFSIEDAAQFTGYPAGVAQLAGDPENDDPLFMPDLRGGALTVEIDTADAVQQDVTAVTPAANDRFFVLAEILYPNKSMWERIDRVKADRRGALASLGMEAA